MRIFKTKGLEKFARRENIADASLKEAIERAERGIVDADLGGGLIKQRVARQGQGRSGGYRMLIAYRKRDRTVFLLAFAKNERKHHSQRTGRVAGCGKGLAAGTGAGHRSRDRRRHLAGGSR